MNSFTPEMLKRPVHPAVVWLINDIARAQGQLDLSERRHPASLKTLRQVALVQSVESSNRIEGVVVSRAALEALVRRKRRPRDRTEEEIAGYREALRWIHAEHANLSISPETICELHKYALGPGGHAGELRRGRSDIYRVELGRAPELIFATVDPNEVPKALQSLCGLYENALNQRFTLPLLALAVFILDLLAIHPFVDGNGRVARLTTTLMLYHQGHDFVRYVSLERIIEQHKEGYYEALERSQVGWHEGRHQLEPWLTYFMTTLKRGYRELQADFDAVATSPPSKSALVQRVIDQLPGEFTKAELTRKLSGVSPETIRNVLRQMKAAGQLQVVGRGRGARWVKVH